MEIHGVLGKDTLDLEDHRIIWIFNDSPKPFAP